MARCSGANPSFLNRIFLSLDFPLGVSPIEMIQDS